MDSQPRPYRSHRIPACDKCRQRKVRCDLEVAGLPCQLCTEKGFDCLFSGTNTSRSSAATADRRDLGRQRKRARLENGQTVFSLRASVTDASADDSGSVALRSSTRQESRQVAQERLRSTSIDENLISNVHQHNRSTSIIVGPMVAEDVNILQQYLTTEQEPDSETSKRPYNVVSSTPRDPAIYLAIPRHRAGLKLAKDPGQGHREILEQILGPNKEEVIRLYFKHIHPSFPVLNEESFMNIEDQGCRVSSALLCQIYAISLTFWNQSESLAHHHCPSEQYFWNLAIAALQDDFLAPTLFTLYPSIIDLLGRPVGSIQGNVINAGRTAALAYSLGLNRDPSGWKTSYRDKDLRIRLFWGCMIVDQWSSFANGIPASILRKQYDVPLPTAPILLTPGKESHDRKQAAECFISLCELSQILGDIMPLVYDLSEPRNDAWKEIRRLERDLDVWEEDLPEYLRADGQEIGTSVSGAKSLRLGYLSIRMLLCRLSLRVASYDDGPGSHDIRQYHLTAVRRAATEIVDFVCSLQSSHLKEFWLSFTGHLIVSATTILLRCAVDTTDVNITETCKETLRKLQRRLSLAKSEDNWDLADMFLERYDEPISRITSTIDRDPDTANRDRSSARALQNLDPFQSQLAYQDQFGLGLGTFSEFNIPMDPLEFQWASAWDMFEGHQENA
ncbi:uncharacterized protein K452DRAFT_217511 [Aplosporella prunicola CBS 121167]|uniref:Zn(2)-C6 fungal-type domain-containing protein n=1 Tax=Aplosporella prunicola CBS 121167 TaxID=1176127 RepID=A0A6A6BWI4_9PEZI|nr:uncharacterized protein K452DRAFT_217511 [Aplosporella prunicola CBS 121167]KAF2147071.1 hypothetical protein K452DRAFT_217511 [Aplosporella prunicola CBS 121167]